MKAESDGLAWCPSRIVELLLRGNQGSVRRIVLKVCKGKVDICGFTRDSLVYLFTERLGLVPWSQFVKFVWCVENVEYSVGEGGWRGFDLDLENKLNFVCS